MNPSTAMPTCDTTRHAAEIAEQSLEGIFSRHAYSATLTGRANHVFTMGITAQVIEHRDCRARERPALERKGKCAAEGSQEGEERREFLKAASNAAAAGWPRVISRRGPIRESSPVRCQCRKTRGKSGEDEKQKRKRRPAMKRTKAAQHG